MADIARQGDGPIRQANAGSRSLGAPGVTGEQHDARARGGEHSCDFLADAHGSTRHYDDSRLKVHERVVLFGGRQVKEARLAYRTIGKEVACSLGAIRKS